MSGNLLHGSVKEVYRTVVNDLPQSWSKLIPASTEVPLAYGRHGDPDHYSLIPLENQEGTKLLFSRCSRKHGASAPSYYVHKQILDVDMDILHSGFEKLLGIPFCSEAEFDRIAEDPMQPLRPDIRWSGAAVPIHPKVLHGILHALISRWRNGSNPVVICVPEMSAREYNAYTFGAICTIYRCLPAALRGKLGFMTYTAAEKQLNSVGIFFLPEREAANGVYLDRENEASRQLMNGYLPDCMEKMLERIAGDPEHCKAELDNLWEQVESKVKLESIRENHYTAFLEYAHLLQVDPEEPRCFGMVLEFFRTPPDIPEVQYTNLRTALCKRITTRVLDTHLLNRQQSDTDFCKYYKRVVPSANLCTCTEQLHKHTVSKMVRYFDIFLQEMHEIGELEQLDALLKKLAEAPPVILPEATIRECSKKWCDRARVIYKNWLESELSSILIQVLETAYRKVPEGATLQTVSNAEPKDVMQAFDLQKTKVNSLLDNVPERLGLTEQHRRFCHTQLKEQIQKATAHLTEGYLEAAGHTLDMALGTVDSNLPGQIRSCWKQLEQLLKGLPDAEPAFLNSARRKYDEKVKVKTIQKAQELLASAEKEWTEMKNVSGATLRKQLNTLQEKVRKQMAYLDVEEARWYSPFYQKTEKEFNAVKNQNAQRGQAGNGKKQQHPWSEYTVDVDAERSQVTTPLNRTGNSAPSSAKDNVSAPPRPLADEDEILNSSAGKRKNVPDDSIDVNNKNLNDIDHGVPDPALGIDRVRLRSTENDNDIIYSYLTRELKAVLRCFIHKMSYQIVLNTEDMKMLMRQLSCAELYDEERVAILKTLVDMNADISVGQACVRYIIGPPTLWNKKDKDTRNIKRYLKKKPEYADASELWKKHLKTKKRKFNLQTAQPMKKKFKYTQCALAEAHSPSGAAVDNGEKLLTATETKMFWRGFLGGVLVTAATFLLLYMFLDGARNQNEPLGIDVTGSVSATEYTASVTEEDDSISGSEDGDTEETVSDYATNEEPVRPPTPVGGTSEFAE